MTLTITHTAADGTLLEGTSRGDGAWEAIKAAQASYKIRGWKYFPSIRAIGVSHSRDKAPKLGLIDVTADVLREAGFEVDIIIDGAPRAMEEAEADRAGRMDDRAEALAGKAQRLSAEADSRYAAAQAIGEHIPMGQPVLVGHHSERGHRRDIKRMDGHMRKSVEAEQEAQSAAQRAQTAERHMEARNNPRRVYRRIRTLEADQRKAQRELTPCTMSGRKMKAETQGRTLGCKCYRFEFTVGDDLRIPEHGSATGRRREEVELRVAHLAEQIRYWREALEAAKAAEADVPPDTDAIKKGYWVKSWAGWCEVKRVNKVSVTVLRSYDNYADKQERLFDQKITLDDIREIRETSPFEPSPAVDLDAELAALDAAEALTCGNCAETIVPDADNGHIHVDDEVAGCGLLPGEAPGADASLAEQGELYATPQAPVRPASGLSAEALEVLAAAGATEQTVHLVGVPPAREVFAEVDGWLRRRLGFARYDAGQRAYVYHRDPRPYLQEVTGWEPVRPAAGEHDKRLAYFATPASLAEAMADLLDLVNGDEVLEPSAGDGALVRAVRAAHPNALIHAVECDHGRARLLSNRYSDDRKVAVYHQQFQGWAAECSDGVTPVTPFRAVIMNPPFTEVGDPLAWATHFLLAWDLLAEGGQMVAILPASYQFSERQAAHRVRELVESSGGTVEDLPEETFKGAGTGVRTVLVAATRQADR